MMYQMKTAPIETVEPSYQRHAINALVLAFSADPAVRWMFPSSHIYLTYFPMFVQVFGGKAFEYDTAYTNSDYSGTALWLPPGIEPDGDAVMGVLKNSIPEQHQADVFAVFEKMEHYHPTYPHWYLPLLGVEPMQQTKGWGSALLQPVLWECDRHHVPAYLESSNPTNIPFYERHGFKVLGTIQTQNSPKITPMIRYPS